VNTVLLATPATEGLNNPSPIEVVDNRDFSPNLADPNVTLLPPCRFLISLLRQLNFYDLIVIVTKCFNTIETRERTKNSVFFSERLAPRTELHCGLPPASEKTNEWVFRPSRDLPPFSTFSYFSFVGVWVAK
jgi:hypothetical protein